MKTTMYRTTPPGPRAFTLIELLTVISIIGLLITMLLPSLGQVRIMARSALTAANLKAIGTGLEMFHDDKVVGGDSYPQSFWDTRLGAATWTPLGGNPFASTYQTPPPPKNPDTALKIDFMAYGAQVLVWGLAGVDMQGTAGFSQSLDVLYEIDANAKPLQPRRGPFIDVDKVNLLYPTLDTSITPPTGLSAGTASLPVFADDFNRPILYFRANLEQDGPNRYIWSPNNRLLFNDNFIFTGLQSANPKHPIADLATKPILGTNRDAWERYTRNTKSTVYQPVNKDSYLLISAGPDGLYGTMDDITNFPLTPANF